MNEAPYKVAAIWKTNRHNEPVFRKSPVNPMAAIFREHGYPISSTDIEEYSDGRLEREDIHTLCRTKKMRRIGCGLYVPTHIEGDLPMSPLVAKKIAAVAMHGRKIVDKHARRLFRICKLMSDKGYAEAKMSRTLRDGHNLQTIRIKVNGRGIELINAAMHPDSL